MTVDTVLSGGKVYFKGEVVDAGIAIEEGRIVKVAKEANLPKAAQNVDLKGYVALPGLIDPHVHLRGQLQSYEEDFFSGTAAAVAGGFTSVLDMPNNQPVTMDVSSLKERMRVAEPAIVANVGFFSAFPRTLDEMGEVVEEGAVGFKLYLTADIGGVDAEDDEALLHVFKKVAKLGVPVAVHAEDRKLVEAATDADNMGVEAYLEAHTPEIEARAVERILRIAQGSQAQIHFCHISSKKSVALIDEAKRRGLKVSCEVTPHHLLLTTEDLKQQGTILLTDPPVRARNIVEGLWRALKNRQVDLIASDHAPHVIAEKEASSVWDVKPGIPGLETSLPLLLTKVNEGRLTLEEIVTLAAEKPAEIFHLHRQGFLEEGYSADITVVDMERRGKIDVSRFYSKAEYSPFDRWEVKGMPVKTLVKGQLAMDDGEVVAEAGLGRILRSEVLGV